MPVVFAQPAPGGAFNNIANRRDSGSDSAYYSAVASMSNAVQGRYASDAEAATRAGLGYAQLNADVGLRTEAQGIQRAEMQMRPLLQAAAIQQRAEMDAWEASQLMTMQDQRKLNQDRIAVSELSNLKKNGLLTDEEYYAGVTKLRSGIDVLAMKDAHTKNQMQQEFLQQQSMMTQEKKTQLDFMNRWNSGEIAAATEYVLNPGAENEMQKHMRDAFPELRPGTPEYDGKLKVEAAAMGKAVAVIRQNGKLVPVADLAGRMGVGQGASRSGGAGQAGAMMTGEPNARESQILTEQQHVDMAAKALEMAGKDPLVREGGKSLTQAAKEVMTFLQEQQGARRDALDPKKQAEVARQAASKDVELIDKTLKDMTNRPDLMDRAGKISSDLFEAKRLLKEYRSPQEMPPAVYQRYMKLMSSMPAEAPKPAGEDPRVTAYRKMVGSVLGGGPAAAPASASMTGR
jgi:hypothetical protein